MEFVSWSGKSMRLHDCLLCPPDYPGYDADFQYLAEQPVVAGWSTPQNLNNGFIAPSAYADPDIICHKGATNAKTSATVRAGGTVEVHWDPWPGTHHGLVVGTQVLPDSPYSILMAHRIPCGLCW